VILPACSFGLFGAIYVCFKYSLGMLDFFLAPCERLDSTIVGWLLYLYGAIVVPVLMILFQIVVVVFGTWGLVWLVAGSWFLLSRGIAVVLQFVRSLYNATEQDETDETFEMEPLRTPMNWVENGDESVRTA
jgi:hypothetical protein